MMDMPLPAPTLFVHELLSNGGGIWIGCGDRLVVEQSHDPGETGEEIVAMVTADLLHARDAQWRAIVAAEVAEEREWWREIAEQLIACHDEPTCPAVRLARERLAAIRKRE